MKKLIATICTITLSTNLLFALDEPTVSGNIDGYGNDRVVAFYVSAANPSITFADTLGATNGVFYLERSITEPMECAIYSNGSNIKRANGKNYLPETNLIKLLLLPNKPLNVTGTLNTYSIEYEVTGDAFNETYSKRRNQNLKQKEAFLMQDLRLDTLAFKGMTKYKLDSIDAILTQAKNKALISDGKYIETHPNEELSAYYTLNMPQDTFLKYSALLTPAVRNGMFKNRLDQLENSYKSVKTVQEAQKQVQVGSKAPDFTLKSLNGNPVSLSSLKGKYVVLDFWGSWCHWCMEGIPKMKEYQAKYAKQVTFVGIDVRDTETAWKEAVQKNGLNWIQLRNLTTADVPALYGVSGYPTKFVLDANQRILARIVGEDPAFYEFLDKLLQPAKK